MPHKTPDIRIEIPIGSTFEQPFNLSDGDTGLAGDPSGWTGVCEVRASYGGPLLTRFTTATDPTYGGQINFVGRVMWLYLPLARTSALSPNTGVYDVILTNEAAEPFRLVKGEAFIIPEVTGG